MLVTGVSNSNSNGFGGSGGLGGGQSNGYNGASNFSGGGRSFGGEIYNIDLVWTESTECFHILIQIPLISISEQIKLFLMIIKLLSSLLLFGLGAQITHPCWQMGCVYSIANACTLLY